MEVAEDFFEYFMAVYPIMKADPTIYCASTWNDNGLEQFVRSPEQLYRTDCFPGGFKEKFLIGELLKTFSFRLGMDDDT
jgi:hypothetical protein